jgi:hypothetical protein
MPGFPSRAFFAFATASYSVPASHRFKPMSKAKGFRCLFHSVVRSLKKTAYQITNQMRSLRDTTATALR